MNNISSNVIWWTIGIISTLLYGFYGYCRVNAPLIGDETYYFFTADSFIQIFKFLIKFEFQSIPIIANELVDRGFFNPFIGLILTPIKLFTSDISVCRIYIFIINLLLHIKILCYINKFLGRNYAILFHILTLLFPLYYLHSFSFFGESIASKFSLILLFYIVSATREKNFEGFSFRASCIIGLLLVITVHSRMNFIILCPIIILLVLMAYLRISNTNFTSVYFKRFFLNSFTITFVFCLLFLPWSFLISNKFGGFYLVNTSIDLAKIVNFSPDSFKKEILPKELKVNQWDYFYQYYLKKAKVQQTSYQEAVRIDKENIMGSISFAERKKRIKDGIIITFYNGRSRVETVRRWLQVLYPEEHDLQLFYFYFDRLSWLMHFMLLGITAIFIFLIYKINYLNIIVKLFLVGSSCQMFWLGSHTRHINFLYPIMLFISVLAIYNLARRKNQTTNSIYLYDLLRKKFYLGCHILVSAYFMGTLIYYFVPIRDKINSRDNNNSIIIKPYKFVNHEYQISDKHAKLFLVRKEREMLLEESKKRIALIRRKALIENKRLLRMIEENSKLEVPVTLDFTKDDAELILEKAKIEMKLDRDNTLRERALRYRSTLREIGYL